MKRLTILPLLALLIGVQTASAQFVITLEDGQQFSWDNLTILSGNDDTWTLKNPQVTVAEGVSIDKVKSITAVPVAERKAKTPTYVDNYTTIASWNARSRWNLSNVHDPTVMRADDGYFYMYQTDASYGNAHTSGGHFHGRRSRNLVDWEYLGGTMKSTPAWVKDSLNSIRSRQGLSAIASPTYGYWAPCVRKVRTDLYRMYYSIVVDNYIKTGKKNTEANFDNSWTERAFIGLMETSDPASNKWEDKGFVVCSSSDKGTNWARPSNTNWAGYFKFNAIDPSYIITPEGEHWLVYGSWHSGIAAVQLDPETGKTLDALPESYGTSKSIAPYGQLIYTRTTNSRWQGSEGPEVVWHDGYYYLFLAYDGLDVPYNTRVLRAEKITGPYKTMGGSNVTNGGDAFPIVTHPYKFSDSYGWVGISHCAVFEDGQGNWYFCSQGRFPKDVDGINASNAIMMGHVRSIRWTEKGWPVVMPERYSGVPQTPFDESELTGEWENISINYDYGKQKTSVSFTLEDSHQVSGSWQKGQKWSYDAEKRVLTIGSLKLYVQRETDWEAGSEKSASHTDRKQTIVYAGYNSNGTYTYWGKKK